MSFWVWMLVGMGVATVLLAGSKVWWCWWLGLWTYVIWTGYGVIRGNWAFAIVCAVLTLIYLRNAILWTMDHNTRRKNAPTR